VKLISLLDLTAAFDCMNLQRNFGITANALTWMTSFLNGRSLQVTIFPVYFGVPRGLFSDPIFLIYTRQKSIASSPSPMPSCYTGSPTTVKCTLVLRSPTPFMRPTS